VRPVPQGRQVVAVEDSSWWDLFNAEMLVV
jgi:hypothetical protein